MNLAHLFEAGMLVCFGFSWPINVVKAYRARTAKSTSLAFIYLIVTGYVAGIIAKMITGQFNYVLLVYFINLAIVLLNAFVYFRNAALDRKRELNSNGDENFKKFMPQNSSSDYSKVDFYDSIRGKEDNTVEKKYNIALMGGTYDAKIPVTLLEKKFNFDFEMLNMSHANLSVKNAGEYFMKNVRSLESDGIIIHLGIEDRELFKSNPSEFDNLYLSLLSTIKMVNKNCRLALVSVSNQNNDSIITSMNNHIKAISSSEQAVFVDLSYATLWNPMATKASVDFAQNMGLNIKKPIFDVAKILYSYAAKNISEEAETENFAG